ncbi:hypothetical protein OH77DRAFT_1556453 [Trametes cingulata]|nr:hypothetical protein OH77DRAFT_1556453 [Trametes cingulata]
MQTHHTTTTQLGESDVPLDGGKAARTLNECLSLGENDLDEDVGIALTSLITTAVHDEEPKHNLANIVEAVKESGQAAELEPLTIIPIIVGSADSSADDLLDLMTKECSAKEVVMAVEEVVENLDRQLRCADENEDGRVAQHITASKQIARLIRAYAASNSYLVLTAIPRLPRWKKSPKDTVESRLKELDSVISHVSGDASPEEGRSIIVETSQLVLALSQGADAETKDLLCRLLESAIAAFPNHIQAGLARQAFASHFRRLVVPQAESSSSAGQREDAITVAWSALRALGVTPSSCSRRPSLATLILLAHDASYTFSTSGLADFFPVILPSLQANVALDEVLSVLIHSLAPLRTATPKSALDTDLIVPLIHLLPHIASNHPDADVRHFTFRIVSLVLGLSPPPVRFGLLKDLLSDEDTPRQMRIAAVGLLKEAVLEGLSGGDQNIFASRHLLSTFGPIVLRPDPPDVFETTTLEEFLDGPEPLRLVESLGFYYVLLQRDQRNQARCLSSATGVRDADSLANVRRSLLKPLETGLHRLGQGTTAGVGNQADHGYSLQLQILEMWLDRVYKAVDAVGIGDHS